MFEIRLRLNDFYESPIENIVVEKMCNLFDDIPLQQICIWYNGTLNKTEASKFQDRWNPILEKKNLKYMVTGLSPEQRYSWFDLISDKDRERLMIKGRFMFIFPHKNKLQILNGFDKYHTMIKQLNTSNRKLKRD